MDMRNDLFSKRPARGGVGLPGRQVQSRPPPGGDMGYDNSPRGSGMGIAPPPSNYDSYGGARSPGRPPNQAAQMGGGGGYGGGGYGGAPPPQAYQQPPPPQQQNYSQQSYSRSRPVTLRLAKVEDKTLQPQYIFGNICAVSPNDFPNPDGTDLYIRLTGRMLRGDYVVTARPTPGFPSGCVSLSDPQRTWCGVGMMDELVGELYDPASNGAPAYLGSMDLEIGFASAKKVVDIQYDQDELADLFTTSYQGQIFAPGQRLLMDVKNVPLAILVKTVTLLDPTMEKQSSEAPTLSDASARGILAKMTTIGFYKDPKTPMKLKASNKRPAANAIISPDFKFENMGIGGLDNEFSTIFRRAFASRIFPPGLIDKLGIMHVKGMLLYGPPGTGKTLIARQIGKMLNAREPKVINGPEVLNKYVGQSEENIRKLFADAEKEYKEKGDESGLHIIIFDELDAVCKQRGSGAGGGTGVGDSVVNQLLSKLDGVDQLNNILLIGMTNRKDMIDDALLRPGRLEVQIEISLPDENGRQQILKIHTHKMKENNVMEDDVDIVELAALSKNFSGAELSGLVKSATSFAFNRHIKVGTMAGVSEDVANMKVNRQDFLNALTEVKPAFGTDDAELETAMTYGIINFSKNIEPLLNDGMVYVENVRKAERLRHLSVLLHGPAASGKTALAAHIALKSEYPFIKMITPAAMVGFRDEVAKKDYLHKIFTDAYKSPLSILIIDNIERIIEWNPVGLRLSNTILQALVTLLQAPPPKGHRLLILATTSQRSVIEQLDLAGAFDRQIPVPAVRDTQELKEVLKSVGAFDGNRQDIEEAVNMVVESNANGGGAVGVGIKTILTIAESAKFSAQPSQWFADQLASQIARYSPHSS
ncbi:P-loop containing nucleoside triphosphate hydrolase protein [Diplogelasinospora grovesii]|uniref:Vesicular-fusion protein SEC18 n=1 Tax=Diplogelasinospora grovesii TaxID=303347 RepID=A0AAN6NAN3_9PEZI|nr:P-loop containing nucleoside triphosphate hydrolase protein [Diplogelasinospora grovesii]